MRFHRNIYFIDPFLIPTYGRIGVKVWVYKGEVLKSAKTAQKKEGGNK